MHRKGERGQVQKGPVQILEEPGLTLALDLRNGVSGDLVLGALLDLGLVDVRRTLDELEIAGRCLAATSLVARRVRTAEGMGTRLVVKDRRPRHVTGACMLELLAAATDKVGLGAPGAGFARDCLMTLLDAECRVHGEDLANIHLHETGRPDTLVDIVGTALVLERSGLLGRPAVGSAISVGSGTVTIVHGTFEVPPPAVRLMLEGLMWRHSRQRGEMATPTGVAILRNLLTDQGESISGSGASSSGLGVGTRKFDGRVGTLRVWLA